MPKISGFWGLTGACIAAAAAVGLLPVSPSAQSALPVDSIKLPAGFHIAVYASGVTAARQMAIGDRGTVFVGSMDAGKVYALPDANHDNRADKIITIASGLTLPSGVAFHDGDLYVGEISRVTRYDEIESRLTDPPSPVVVNDTLPKDRPHGWKFIAFGPDGWLYVPVGAPCNICEPDERHGVILRMKADGSGLETFASGIRNSVGFDWDPRTKNLWFTDNGRDNLGNDVPSDELNHAPKKGMHFGYPYCHQGDLRDPVYGSKQPCSASTPPARKLGPHVASLGMTFYTGRMFPPEYRNQIFIAEHGSWNRSTPIGYRVVAVTVQGNKAVSERVFAEGWLRGVKLHAGQMTQGDAWGRPVDVLVMPDGALLVSDDTGNAVYRISYGT
jgi:glucose/arabinose dehydrogenase